MITSKLQFHLVQPIFHTQPTKSAWQDFGSAPSRHKFQVPTMQVLTFMSGYFGGVVFP